MGELTKGKQVNVVGSLCGHVGHLIPKRTNNRQPLTPVSEFATLWSIWEDEVREGRGGRGEDWIRDVGE